MKSCLLVALTALAASGVNAECPNACSGHGTCGARDACSCYKNWMGNDCSLRICPFAHAFVDTPKGDLDMTGGALSTPATNARVATGDEVYPEGTTEMYPDADPQEGHFYMECANKGLCNRKSGECECFDGYEGTACARTVCPNSCSGHGTCETVQELAEMGTFDTQAVHVESTTAFSYSYNLWDHEKTVGCKCDEQWFGTDCAQRKCKYGVDPLFESEGKRIAAEFNVYSDATAGTFKLKMYDVFGDDYITEDIDFDATADEFCQAIDVLPNGVFNMDRSAHHTLGTQHATPEDDLDYYTCDATGLHTSACCERVGDGEWNVYLYNNPGPLKAPEFFTNTVDKFTATNKGVGHVSFAPGEYMDYFGLKLDVSSQLLDYQRVLPIESIATNEVTMASSLVTDVTSKLTALGVTYPALMKIEHEVVVVSSYTGGVFTLANNYGSQPSTSTAGTTNALAAYYVFFASATLTELTNSLTAVFTQPSQGTNTWVSDVDMSSGLAKEDQFVYNDLLFTVHAVASDGLSFTSIENYGGSAAAGGGLLHKVVWGKSAATNFEYATQCSNRGTCDYSAGLCECFPGYSNDNCNTQNAYSN